MATDDGNETTAAELEGGGGEEAKKYDWQAYYDDEGTVYYYNSATDESRWEPPPEGFNPPEEEEPPSATAAAAEEQQPEAAAVAAAQEEPAEQFNDGGGGIPGQAAEGGDEAAAAGTATATAADASKAEERWVAYQDDEDGREYYYNTVTGETQWEKPEGVEVIQAEEYEDEQQRQAAEEEGAAEQAAEPDDEKGPSAEAEVEETQQKLVEEEPLPMEEEEEEEEAVDPAVKRLRDAEEFLGRPDSVMESDCMKHVTEVVTGSGGNPQKAISALIESYYGQTAICGLLGRWLADMRTTTSTADGKKASSSSSSAAAEAPSAHPSEATANRIREVCQDVVYKISKERFSKESGDGIIQNLSKSEAAFLEEMMDSPRWRRLLIDLSASHKDSAVLVYCLRAISQRGHHREIAKRINPSDHYAVFNAMLLSELSVIGRLAVSAGSDHAASIGIEELINDLRRACSSTSYTYLYSMEMLRYLAERTRVELTNMSSDYRMNRVLRKWEALVQDLESAMMDPSASSSEGGSSPLFRKRRLEVALTISDLHQRQRKRGRLESGNHISYEAIGKDRKSPLESSLLKFLERHAVGIQIDDAILDPLLPQGLDMDGTAEMVGSILIQHPLAIRAILGYLYKPGSTRITAPVVKNKAARLVALAVLAAEKAAIEEQGNDEESTSERPESSDEVAITRMILDGSQLCEQLESMVSFLVTADPESSKPISAGQKICSLAIKYAVVSQGVMLWAREFTRGPEFSGSASYPTLSTSILSLVRIISEEQPFARRDALEIALSFLSHSNSDISYKKMNAIKEQSLRLLLFLLLKGEVSSVLGAVAVALKGQDVSLVRYFVGGVVDVVRPPVSLAFVRALDGLLRDPRCLDAVRSSYFSEPQRKKLVSLLKSFEDIRAQDDKPLAPEDAALVSSILAAYKFYYAAAEQL